MFEINQDKYLSVKHFLENIKCDTIYAYSIIEQRQKGRIFVDNIEKPQTVLFWHYCGLSVITGRADNDDFNNFLKILLLRNYEENQQVFALWVNDCEWNKQIARLICDYLGITIKERLRFNFNREHFCNKTYTIPEGFILKEVDSDILSRLEGRIIPSSSWHSSKSFLSNGKGYCLMKNDSIACNAFSSAIGNGMIDIGIETMTSYRNKRLAVPTAAVMVRYCLDNGFDPCWGCNTDNIGSIRLAQSLGYEITDSHPMYVSV